MQNVKTMLISESTATPTAGRACENHMVLRKPTEHLEDDEKCEICRNDIIPCKALKCGHSYHSHCVIHWLGDDVFPDMQSEDKTVNR